MEKIMGNPLRIKETANVDKENVYEELKAAVRWVYDGLITSQIRIYMSWYKLSSVSGYAFHSLGRLCKEWISLNLPSYLLITSEIRINM